MTDEPGRAGTGPENPGPSGSPSPEPPRLARTLLRRLVPNGELRVVEGELLEGFRSRAAADGRAAAARWYRMQVWGFLARAISVRASTRREPGRDGMGWIEAMSGDVRWALRGLRKRPTFTLVAVATLALGIGANSAIFTLVSAHFFEPLPYERPDELVLLWESGRNTSEVTTVAPGNYFAWREQATSLVDIAAYNVNDATISGDASDAARVDASVVVPHFFDVLGVRAQLGTTFDEASVRAADRAQVVLSHGLWMSRYAGDPGVVGRDVRVNGRPHTIIGVLPPEFRQPERELTWQATQLWRPMLLDDSREDFGSRYLRAIARRAPGVSVEQTREEMRLLGQRLVEAHPEENANRQVLVRELDEYFMGAARPTLMMLLAAGVAVLLIVCANVANLTLARGEERRREFAVRAALGSGSTRLLRQVLVEGVVLALLGAGFGAAMVWGGSGVLQSIQERFFSGLIDVAVDWRVIGFTTLVAVGAGVLFGLPLARSAARADVRSALVEGGERSGGASGANATRNLLIVGQVGLATTLLVVAALLSRSFDELVNVSPGFEPSGVVAFEVAPPSTVYPDTAAAAAYHRRLIDELRSIPGVQRVGLVSDLMFTTWNMGATLAIDGFDADPDDPPGSEFHVILPEYFDALGIPVLAGELPRDGWEVPGGASAEVPVVVNQRLAEAYWPAGDVLGARMTFDWNPEQVLRVVAVVGDVLDDGFDAVPEPAFFVPFGAMPRWQMSYVVRVAGDPAGVVPALRSAVARVDPDVPAGNLSLLDGMMAETAARPRAASLIGMTFAVLALLVSAAGIYGVLSYSVQARTREIGIRTALGATGAQIVSMVMGHSTRLVVLGLALGTVGALLSGRLLSSLLFGVRSWDPLSFLAAAVVLGSVATLAAWLPARRAVTIDPKEALRAD